MEDVLKDYLQTQFGCQTAILYGSRARGDWDDTSDIDVLALADAGETGHLAHRWGELFLDLFVYRSGTKPELDWMRLQGGRVLFQRGSEGDETLLAVAAMFSAGPPRLSANEQRTLRLWCEKMLRRAEKGDVEGNHRLHWLLWSLPEIYSNLRGEWYLGPKRQLEFMARERTEHFGVLTRALAPGASVVDIEAAVTMVVCGNTIPPSGTP